MLGGGGREDSLPAFSAGCLGGNIHSFMLSFQHFFLPTTASPTLQGALGDDFGEDVVACDMSEPYTFPSLDSCQKRFLWTHKEVDPDPYPVVGLILQVGDAEKLPYVRGFESLDPFFRVSKQGVCFIAIEEDGGDKRLVQL